MINVTDVVDTSKVHIDGKKPEVEANPVPAIIVNLPSADDFRKTLKLTPPQKKDEVEENWDVVIGPASPVMRIASETIVEVNHRGNDPRLGYVLWLSLIHI